MEPVRTLNGSGPPAELQPILRGIYHFLGMEGVELIPTEGDGGSGFYQLAASLVRRASLGFGHGKIGLPVLTDVGTAREIVLVDRRMLEAFCPVYMAERNEELL